MSVLLGLELHTSVVLLLALGELLFSRYYVLFSRRDLLLVVCDAFLGVCPHLVERPAQIA